MLFQLVSAILIAALFSILIAKLSHRDMLDAELQLAAKQLDIVTQAVDSHYSMTCATAYTAPTIASLKTAQLLPASFSPNPKYSNGFQFTALQNAFGKDVIHIDLTMGTAAMAKRVADIANPAIVLADNVTVRSILTPSMESSRQLTWFGSPNCQ